MVIYKVQQIGTTVNRISGLFHCNIRDILRHGGRAYVGFSEFSDSVLNGNLNFWTCIVQYCLKQISAHICISQVPMSLPSDIVSFSHKNRNIARHMTPYMMNEVYKLGCLIYHLSFDTTFDDILCVLSLIIGLCVSLSPTLQSTKG